MTDTAITNIAIIFATLLGPIFAVQAQKAIEKWRDRQAQKTYLFQQLMATRGSRLSREHVQGLNMIDIVFYGHKSFFGKDSRSAQEQAVLNAWKEYHDHLNVDNDQPPTEVWGDRRDELFVTLLYVMARDVGFQFDRVQIKKGSYLPRGHSELEDEQTTLRKLTTEVLSGNRSLKMDVVSFATDEEALKAQINLQTKLATVIEDGSLAVTVKEAP